jgi:hypothetical protein
LQVARTRKLFLPHGSIRSVCWSKRQIIQLVFSMSSLMVTSCLTLCENALERDPSVLSTYDLIYRLGIGRLA